MNMEDMIRRLTDMENESTKQLNEAAMPMAAPGAEPAPAPAPGASEGSPVSINVSMNASGKEHVADLLGMMKNAGLGDAQEVSPDMMPMRQDMERLRGIVDEPSPEEGPEGPEDSEGDDEELEPSVGQEDIESSDEADLDEYENEPDEDYQDHKYMTKDLSGGLNREKKAYADAEDGDNPMAVKAEEIKRELMKSLGEKRLEKKVGESDKPNVKRLWAQINQYEQQAKKTKSPIKKDHYMKMASELRDKLPTDEDHVDEISADKLRAYRDKAQSDIGAKTKDMRSRVKPHQIPQGDDAKLDKKIKDRSAQKSKAVQKIMKKDPTPAPKRGEKYPLGGRDSKSGRSYSS